MALITIPNYEKYSIDEYGNVYSKNKQLKSNIDKRGYLRVWLYKNKIRKEMPIHRAVAISFLGYKENLTVNHKDGNKLNNHISNLEWISNADNIRHSFINNIRPKETMGKRKNNVYAVSLENQTQIICAFETGLFNKTELAKEFNCHRSTIRRILNNYNNEALKC